jgi:hypothetical protein
MRLVFVALERLGGLFEYAVKIAVIVAAVAAINLLAAKPRLGVATVCSTAVDDGAMQTAFFQSTAQHAPLWLELERQSLVERPAPTPDTQGLLGGGCMDPAGELTAAALAVEGGQASGLVVRRDEASTLAAAGKGKVGAQLAQLDPEGFGFTDNASALEAASKAVDAVAVVTAQVTVTNTGAGGAANVRVESPPAFAAPGVAQAGFALAPGESRLLTFQSSGGDLASLSVEQRFLPSGDRQRNVSTTMLIVLGTTLGVLALIAWSVGVIRASRPATPGGAGTSDDAAD